ncbi:MAG: hypothetical protein KTR28_02325 [Micavibrio sp.]|nr:hypothetical protein [Micavibrio sp.]
MKNSNKIMSSFTLSTLFLLTACGKDVTPSPKYNTPVVEAKTVLEITATEANPSKLDGQCNPISNLKASFVVHGAYKSPGGEQDTVSEIIEYDGSALLFTSNDTILNNAIESELYKDYQVKHTPPEILKPALDSIAATRKALKETCPQFEKALNY